MKHRTLKRMMGFLLAAVLVLGVLAGCSGASGSGGGNGEGNGENGQGENPQAAGEQSMGRFLEDELDMGVEFGNIYDMKKQEDGSLRIVGTNADDNSKCVWESKDAGKTWEKAYDFPKELQNEEEGYIDYASLSSDGQLVCGFNRIADGGVKAELYLLDKQGNASLIPFELPEGKGGNAQSQSFAVNVGVPEGGRESEDSEEPEDSGKSEDAAESEDSEEPEDSAESEGSGEISNLIMDIRFLGSDQVLAKDMEGTVYQINIADGTVKHTYEFDATTETYQTFLAGTILIAQNSSQVLLYDTQTGEQKSSEEALNKAGAQNGFFNAVDTMDAGESVYCLSSGGLYHYKFGGSVMEQLIDGSMNSLGAPGFYPIALTMIDEQNLLVAANDSNSDSALGLVVLKYTYSADTPAKPDKELKVYSLNDNREIRQSISRFQKEHTDVYVNYQTALSEENGVTVSDALKTLTTEIMAGNGPDVLLLDGMPVETYIEKGVLKDLSGLMKENGGSYFENIISAYQDAQGQMCAVPARFKIPMIHADSEYYTPGEDFNTFTERKGTMVNMEPKMVLEKFWYTCGAAWQKEDKTLDEAKITEFLSRLKNAYGEYDSNAEQVNTSVGITVEGGGTDEVNDVSLSRGDFDLAFGKWKTNFGLYGSMDYGMQQAVNKKLKDGKRDLMPGQADHVFVPAMTMGISNKSAQMETAEEFVKYLFSNEAQKVSQFGGFPVEKDAFRSVVDGHEYEGKDNLVAVGSAGDNMDEILDFEMVPTPEEEITKLTEIVESLATPALQDDVIKDVVVEQGEKVLKGEISPEEGTAAIMQKVNIYLAE